MSLRYIGGKATTTFNESVVVAGTSFSILQSGEVLTFFNKDNSAKRSGVNKVQCRIPGCLIFDNTRKNFKPNLVLVVVLVLESKGL